MEKVKNPTKRFHRLRNIGCCVLSELFDDFSVAYVFLKLVDYIFSICLIKFIKSLLIRFDEVIDFFCCINFWR